MFDNCDSEEIQWYKPNNNEDKGVVDQDNEKGKMLKEQTIDEETNTNEMIDEETQLNIKDLLSQNIGKEYDQKALAQFLPKAYALINDALLLRNDEIFDVLYEEELMDQVYNHQSLLKLASIDQSMDASHMKISDVQVSNNGRVLAVAYFIDEHIGPCSHSSLITFHRINEAIGGIGGNEANKKTTTNPNANNTKLSLEVNACIKCIDSHPMNNNLFIAGSYIGEVYLINIANHDDGKDMAEAISKIDSMFYKECIISVKWIKYEDNVYYIVSLSEEGRVLVWHPIDKLKYPVIGFNLKYNLGKSTMPINPFCLNVNPFDQFCYLIGAYDGNIYKCQLSKPNEDSGSSQDHIFLNKQGVVWRQAVRTLISNMKEKEVIEMKSTMERICLDKGIINLDRDEFYYMRPDVKKVYKNALKAHYEKHFGLVTCVAYNYFIKNLFMTTSYDGTLRLYNANAQGTKYFYTQMAQAHTKQGEGDDYVYYTCCAWSAYKPSLIAAGMSNGTVTFGVITSKNTVKEVLTVEANQGTKTSVVKILFNRLDNNGCCVVSIVYDNGIIEVILLSEGFSRVGNSEIEKLYKICY